MAVNAAAKGWNLAMRRLPTRKPARAVAAFAIAMAAGLALAGGAQAAGTPAQKMPLTQTNRSCDGTLSGEPTTRPFGFAVIRETGHGRLVATVALKGGPPNTAYNVRLIQVVAGDADCIGVGGTLTTDDDGNGNANVHEVVRPGASRVWVVLNNRANFAEFFDTQVVSF